MLTSIRRSQKWVLIAVCVIIVISFSLYTGFDAGRSANAADTAFCIYGKCYGEKEAVRIARYHSVAQSLGFGDFARSMFGEERMGNDRTEFVMSLLILRKEAEKMGISPTNEEVAEGWKNLPLFTQMPWIDGKFIKNNVTGPAGFTKADEYQLMKDYLSWQQLRSLLEAGIQTTDDEVDRIYKQRNRQFSTKLITFDRSEFLKKTEVTDEEIQTYFDEHKGEILTEEARAFDYYKISMAELPEGASNEAKSDARVRYLRDVEVAYLEAIKEDTDFSKLPELVEKAKAEGSKDAAVKKPASVMKFSSVGPFPRTEPAEVVAEATELLNAVFARTVTAEKAIPVPVKEDPANRDSAYYIIKLKEIVDPREQTLEESRDQIVTVLKNQKANKAVEEAAQAAQAKINEALESGKSFADAAKAAGVKATDLPQFSPAAPPVDTDDAGQIVGAVTSLDAGELSGVIERARGAGYLLVYVDKIVIFENENEAAERESLAKASKSLSTSRIFNAWFRKVKSQSEAFAKKSIQDLELREQLEEQQKKAAEEAAKEA